MKEYLFWTVIVVAMILINGCAVEQRPTDKEAILKSDLTERGKAWFMVLSGSDKQFGLLILIGVIGGAAAFYFKEAKLLGIPLFCAAGCFFLKFLITAGDILAYVCLVGVVLLLVFYSARYWRAAKEIVTGVDNMKTTGQKEAYETFKQWQKQSKPTKDVVKEIKAKL